MLHVVKSNIYLFRVADGQFTGHVLQLGQSFVQAVFLQRGLRWAGLRLCQWMQEPQNRENLFRDLSRWWTRRMVIMAPSSPAVQHVLLDCCGTFTRSLCWLQPGPSLFSCSLSTWALSLMLRFRESSTSLRTSLSCKVHINALWLGEDFNVFYSCDK